MYCKVIYTHIHTHTHTHTCIKVANKLPAHGPLLCFFNQHFKIDPDTFAVWMRAIKAADNARLAALVDVCGGGWVGGGGVFTFVCTLTRTQTHTHSLALTHSLTQTRARARTHTHTHTQTYRGRTVVCCRRRRSGWCKGHRCRIATCGARSRQLHMYIYVYRYLYVCTTYIQTYVYTHIINTSICLSIHLHTYVCIHNTYVCPGGGSWSVARAARLCPTNQSKKTPPARGAV